MYYFYVYRCMFIILCVGQFSRITAQTIADVSVKDSKQYPLITCSDSLGGTWSGSAHGLEYRLGKMKKVFRYSPFRQEGLPNDTIIAMCLLSKTMIAVATASGYCFIDMHVVTTKKIVEIPYLKRFTKGIMLAHTIEKLSPTSIVITDHVQKVLYSLDTSGILKRIDSLPHHLEREKPYFATLVGHNMTVNDNVYRPIVLHGDTIHIPRDQFVVIDFSPGKYASSLVLEDSLLFSSFMDDFDVRQTVPGKSWRRAIHIQRGGTYRLRAFLMNLEGQIIANPAFECYFVVPMLWWEKTSVRWSIGLSLVSIVLGSLRYSSIQKQRRRERIMREELLAVRNQVLETHNKLLETENKLYVMESSSLQLANLSLAMNPHFVFNILVVLHRLAGSGDPQQVQAYLLMFINLLRYIVSSSVLTLSPPHKVCDDQQSSLDDKEMVPDRNTSTSDIFMRNELTQAFARSFDEDIDFLRNYVAMESFRISKHIEFRIHCANENIRKHKIPAMILQPLVENSVKYGIEQHSSPLIEIDIDFYAIIHPNDAILCTVTDNGQEIRKKYKMYMQSPYGKSERLAIATPIIEKRLRMLIEPYIVPDTFNFLSYSKDNEGNIKASVIIPLIDVFRYNRSLYLPEDIPRQIPIERQRL